MSSVATVVGAGLAGSECAYQLAQRGVQVRLVEQKPTRRTPAQRGDGFAELVCSNSFRGAALVNAVGLLKEEMRRSGSLIMNAAAVAAVPAGGALAVDRDTFSHYVTDVLRAHPLIDIESREVTEVPVPKEGPVVLATGPLTSDRLASDLAKLVGEDQLAYYDAIAPVVAADSIDWDRVFRASRYDKGGDDAYVNCPMDEATYRAFVAAIVEAEKVEPRDFEQPRYFEGCLPVEVMAERGPLTLAYGPMKPVGLVDPRTGQRPFAVVQLRQEDRAATAYNLVGFQTRMKWPEQRRVFRMIPGLEEAEFVRLGSVHRNTFLEGPSVLTEDYDLRVRRGVYLAGQIMGVEGYVESAAIGLTLGATLGARLAGHEAPFPPPDTALGALLRYTRSSRPDYQPSNVLWSMFEPLEVPIRGPRKGRKRRRHEAMAERALTALEPWLADVGGSSGGQPSIGLPAPQAPQVIHES